MGVVAALNGSAQQAAVDYRVEEVLPPAGFDSIHVCAFNNLGQFVGGLDGPGNRTHAFIWDKGKTTDLGTFGGMKALATGINDSGEIVGAYELTNGSRHAFLWRKGVLDDLGEIDKEPHLGFEGELYHGGPGQIYWVPQIAINNHGQVVGHFWERSFLLSDGKISYFGPMTNGQIFYGESISDSGDIMGRATQTNGMRPMLWRKGAPFDLTNVGGGQSSILRVSGTGALLGSATSSSNGLRRGFVWEDGKVRWLAGSELGELHAESINNAGDVVGYVSHPSRGFPCLWRGDQIYDLSGALRLEAPWRAVVAHGINERGQIWMTATNGLGPVRYFLLTPLNFLAGTAPSPALEVELAPVAPFNMKSLDRLSDGRFRMVFTGAADGNYVVEASTNMKDWMVLGAATNNGGQIDFIDADAPKFAMRFYRVIPAK